MGQEALMLDSVAAESAPSAPRRRWKLWIGIGAVLALLAAAAITAVAVSFHYLHAPRLEAFGLGWLPPDNRNVRFVQAGPYSATVIPARPGNTQVFTVEIHNPSSVTQTVLGLAYDTSQTAEPEHLTISTTSTAVGDASFAHYAAGPVDIPPGDVRTLRIARQTSDCSAWGHGDNRSEFYTEVALKVRVGAFTRIEHVSFGRQVLELRGTSPPC